MTILKTESFASPGRLVLFINENGIVPANILTITEGPRGSTIYFYADSEVEEITHGLFS